MVDTIEIIGVMVLFIAAAAIAFFIGHDMGYRKGQAVMIGELNRFMEQAKSETEEVRKQLLEIEGRIDKVSDDLDNM